MDHHCQWVNNCIGHRNYKYFLNMLFYASLLLQSIAITYSKCYIDVSITPELANFEVYLIALHFWFCIILGIIVTGFTVFHFWLVSTNTTTIEFCEKKKDSGKYSIKMLSNWKQVFGNNSYFCWFCPTEPDIGDGTTFEVAD